MKTKKILMGLLKDKIECCEACMLCKGRNHVVFGNGATNADLMIVGEAPCVSEDDSGRVLMGETGAKLDKILKYYKLNDKDVFITNAVCCRPPNDRYPLFEEEIVPCRHRLACQISIIRPKVILGLGPISHISLLGNSEYYDYLRSVDVCKEGGSFDALLNKMHIVEVDGEEYPTFFSYSPSYLLRESSDDSVKTKAKVHWDRVVGFLDIQK
jgi:DNA polymerase